MFNNKTKENTKSNNNEIFSANTIQAGTSIEGNIVSEGSIRIDGVLNGSLKTKAKLVIGKTGIIKGDIICKDASIEGTVEGKVEAQNLLDLRSTAKITGDLYISKIVVEAGAQIDAQIVMSKTANQKNTTNERQTSFKHKEAV